MKRLLLTTLFLIGTMLYGQPNIVEINSGSSGRGSLPIEVRGEVVDPASNAFLIITPTVSANPDGTALGFNHGKIFQGNLGQKLMGKFEAKVVRYKGGTTEEIIPGTYNSSILSSVQNAQDYPTNTTEFISLDIKGYDVSDPRGKKIGTLTYQLFSNANETTKIYEGTIYSQLDATDTRNTTTGSFIDRSTKIEVSVSKVNLTPAVP